MELSDLWVVTPEMSPVELINLTFFKALGQNLCFAG